MKRLYLYIFFFFMPFLILAQDSQDVHLKGRVIDEEQEAVPFCIVRLEGQPIGTTADINGQYKLDFNTADSVTVVYSMMGYETKKRVLKKPMGNLNLNVTLKSSGMDMQEVTVANTRRQMGSTQELNTKDMKRMPSTTGNAVEEMVATQAGVSSHNELSSQYNHKQDYS